MQCNIDMSISPLPGAQRVVKSPLCWGPGTSGVFNWLMRLRKYNQWKINKTVLDSEFQVVDSGNQVLDSWFFVSGFRIAVVSGIRIPWVVFRIPKPGISDSARKIFRVPDSTGKVFLIPDSGIRIPIFRATKTSTVQTLQEASNAFFFHSCFLSCYASQEAYAYCIMFLLNFVLNWT